MNLLSVNSLTRTTSKWKKIKKKHIQSPPVENVFELLYIHWNNFWHMYEKTWQRLWHKWPQHWEGFMNSKLNSQGYLQIKMSTGLTPEVQVCWKANTWYLCCCWCNVGIVGNLDTLPTVWELEETQQVRPDSDWDKSLQCGTSMRLISI